MKYKSTVPEGISGDWRVERFTVSPADEQMERIRALISFSSRGRFVPAGNYTRLMYKNSVVMSDTPDEVNDHWAPVRMAKGHCLINGLGLGVVLDLICQKNEVEFVTVVEISEDVMRLVGEYFREIYGDRIELIIADAYLFKPPKGERYGMVWHDIWNDLCGDNLEGMKKLHRKYGRRTDWQGSWGRELCQR